MKIPSSTSSIASAIGPNLATGPSPGMGTQPMVDSIIEAENSVVRSSEARKEKTVSVRDQLKSFDGMLGGFGKSLDGLKKLSDFQKIKLESSNPDILEGVVGKDAKVGSYELEVDGLAKSAKQLAFGFPDVDKTEVGFGHMRVGVAGNLKDINIDPGATLNDMASAINDAGAGVKASIVNTGISEEPFRLLVSSVETGAEAVMEIDGDTTFAEFKSLSDPTNLTAKFEGVDISRANNKLDDLIEGVSLSAKKASQGEKIQINISHDIEMTSTGIKDFVKQYNDLVSFAKKESQVDAQTGKAGVLSGDASLRGAINQLQRTISGGGSQGMSLVQAGISTDPFSGELKIDETKLKDAMQKDYEGVSRLFASSQDKGVESVGLAEKLSQTVKQLQDRETGMVSTRLKGLDQRIQRQDEMIAKQSERVEQKRVQLQKTFAALNAKMAGMESNQNFLAARMGTPQAA